MSCRHSLREYGPMTKFYFAAGRPPNPLSLRVRRKAFIASSPLARHQAYRPIITLSMPPTDKNLATTKKSVYAWTRGNKRSITHVELIGMGGFGEVHKV